MATKNNVTVKGHKTTGHGNLPRLEIDDFIKNNVLVNLLLIAYTRLQDYKSQQAGQLQNLRDMRSFFNIAGKPCIHAEPSHAFDGIQGNALSAALQDTGRLHEWNTYNQPNLSTRVNGNLAKGYCVHGTLLFLSWHRCYGTLWEQIVFDKVLEVAQEFGSLKMLLEAKKFRLPYFDPLRPRGVSGASNDWTSRSVDAWPSANVDVWTTSGLTYGLPPILTKKKIRIFLPNPNDPVTSLPTADSPGNAIVQIIDNPFYRYTFPTQANMADSKLGIDTLAPPLPLNNPRPASQRFFDNMVLPQKVSTARCPDATGYSQHIVLNRNINNVADAKRQKIYQILTTDQHYIQMCCVATACQEQSVKYGKDYSQGPQAFQIRPSSRSLESFHDDFHTMIGGNTSNTGGDNIKLVATANGSMFNSNYAAFDPIFFIYHGVIERLLCLWQHQWPGRWWNGINPPDSDPNHYAIVPLPATARGYKDDQLFNNPKPDLDPVKHGLYDGDPSYDLDAHNVNEPDGKTGRTFWEPYGTWEKADTPLIPFRREATGQARWANQEWWTTEALEDYTQFGYYYSDIQPTNDKDRDKAKAIETINKCYGWYHANPDATLRDRNQAQAIMRPLDYTNWAILYPCFVDDPRSDPDDTRPIAAPAPIVASPMMVPAASPAVGGSSGSSGSASHIAVASRSAARPHVDDLPSTNALPTNAKSGIKTFHPITPEKPTEAHTETVVAQAVETHVANWTAPTTTVNNGKMRLWNFNYIVTRQAFEAAFQIYVFIGDFPEPHTQWASEPHLVSVEGIFTTRTTKDDDGQPAGHCPNCAVQAATSQDYSDFVPLTKMLVDYTRTKEKQPPGEEGMVLQSLEPNDVIPFLRRNLHWRVVGPDGPVDRANTPGLQVTVSSQMMTLPKTMQELPVYEKEDFHVDITDSRPSGVSHADLV